MESFADAKIKAAMHQFREDYLKMVPDGTIAIFAMREGDDTGRITAAGSQIRQALMCLAHVESLIDSGRLTGEDLQTIGHFTYVLTGKAMGIISMVNLSEDSEGDE